MIKYIIFVAVACLPLACFGLEQNIVVRAAVDIGSGATKLKVAEVNLKTQKIEKVLVNTSFPVQYQEELEKSSDGAFNETVMNTGLDALKKISEIAKKYGANKVVAVATASFRKAKNVESFIDRIYKETGVQVHIIDQKLEGILGFEAVAAQVEGDPKDMVVWDIGGGSFQFSSLDKEGQIVVYRGEDASIPFKNHVIKAIKLLNPNTVTTPNPLNQVEIQDAAYHARQLSKKVDTTFKNKIASSKTKIIGIGNIFAYGIYPLVEKKNHFTQKELFEKVQQLEDKSDKDLGEDAYVNVFVTNSILILGFMQTLHISNMDIIDINNADGALLYSSFWKTSKESKVAAVK
jgi:exopolyphosphatase / guanosine-5'-triphosphate,3'-diphosphate pyrophosphatase